MSDAKQEDDPTQARQVWPSLKEEIRKEVLAEFHRVIKEMIDEHFRVGSVTTSKSTRSDLRAAVEPQPGDYQQREPADAVRAA